MLGKLVGVLGILLILSISYTQVFALIELQRVTINDPRLENTSGTSIVDNINVNQSIQVSVDVTNIQEESQNFVYIVQIKNNAGFVVSLTTIAGVELNPHQKFSLSLPWTPNESGKYTAEIFIWESLINHSALVEYTTLQINVS